MPERTTFFSSKRFAVRIPFEGARWRVDDHSAPYLVAAREGTGGSEILKLGTFHALSPLTHEACAELGQRAGMLDSIERLKAAFEPISAEMLFLPLNPEERTSTLSPDGFRTKVTVSVKRPKQEEPNAALDARLLAIGTDNRKCFIFEYTVPTNANDGRWAGDRLGIVRRTVLEKLDWRTQEDAILKEKR